MCKKGQNSRRSGSKRIRWIYVYQGCHRKVLTNISTNSRHTTIPGLSEIIRPSTALFIITGYKMRDLDEQTFNPECLLIFIIKLKKWSFSRIIRMAFQSGTEKGMKNESLHETHFL